jgi:hypothetical protein
MCFFGSWVNKGFIGCGLSAQLFPLPASALDIQRAGPEELQRSGLCLLYTHQTPSGERGFLAAYGKGDLVCR